MPRDTSESLFGDPLHSEANRFRRSALFCFVCFLLSLYDIFIGTHLLGSGDSASVDLHLAVCNDRLDLALLLEVLEAPASQGAVDLHAVDKSGDGDETVRLNILVKLLRDGLVEHDSMLGLVLDYLLRCDVSL